LKALSVGYVLFLTALLLTPNPNRVVGYGDDLPNWLAALLPIAHLLSFFLLTVLFLAARWPVPWWLWIAVLIGYGAATEGAQGLIPSRTPDWEDWFQDMAGVLLGVIVCGAGCLLIALVRANALRRSSQ
jgi:VanZ family protein